MTSLLEGYYDYALGPSSVSAYVNEMSLVWLEAFKSKWKTMGRKPVLKILEVGAGTGAYTTTYLELLEKLNIDFEFTYTDISSAFFSAAETKFRRYGKQMKFQTLNLEEDPLSQGFQPEYFDIVLSYLVVHATRNLKQTTTNIRTVLKPNGLFELFEITALSPHITGVFGLLEGFWRFEDFDVRPIDCHLSGEGWINLLERSGFHDIHVFYINGEMTSHLRSFKNAVFDLNEDPHAPLDKSWLLFHDDDPSEASAFLHSKLAAVPGREIFVVRRGDRFEINGLEVTLRANAEQDFVELMKILSARCKLSGGNVEGVVYCWSLNDKWTEQQDILQPILYLTKSLLNDLRQNGLPRLCVLVKGVVPAVEDVEFSGLHLSGLAGFMKTLKNEVVDWNCRYIDIGDSESMHQIFNEIWTNDQENQVAYFRGNRYIPKLQMHQSIVKDLGLPVGVNRFQLKLPDSKSFSDLSYQALSMESLKSNQIELQTKCSALNFRDIFNVMKPSEHFRDSNSVGSDVAGVVTRVGADVTKWKVGDRCYGHNSTNFAFPSHLNLDEDDLLKIPNDMTYAEASTLPCAFLTSILCLMDVAKLKAGETALIHAASGGIGLSAIQICKHIGAKIIATAGSIRKRKYLASLGIEHVLHSRKTDYGDQILEITNGTGIDVVLNSLTGEGFKEATLKACATGARFVEMSKLSIWTPEEVRQFRPDVDYTVVDLTTMSTSELRRLMGTLQDLVVFKFVNPLPFVSFPALNVIDALNYLQKAKHLGKVVCQFPEQRRINEKLVTYTPLFNDKSTYLITGGLGGIGFEVCKWMVEKGAKHVLLAGRNSPTNIMAAEITSINNENGADVRAVQLDVGIYSECHDLMFNKINEWGLPPVRGVMHSAGTLNDMIISNHSWNSFATTFKSKIDGTTNLHDCTKHLTLEHFVMFSSAAALMGPPGQSNHAAGNNFQDIFAHYRHSLGLPATSINWGQWSEVGIATELRLLGYKAHTTYQGFMALEYGLKSQQTQLAAFNMESPDTISKVVPQLKVYFDDKIWKGYKSNRNVSEDPRKQKIGHLHSFWTSYEALENEDGRLCMIRSQVISVLRSVLNLKDSDVLSDENRFSDLGVDSLMFIEIKNGIQAVLGNRVTLNINVVKDSDSVGELSMVILKLIERNSENDDAETNQNICDIPPTPEEVAALLEKDCMLDDSIRKLSGTSQQKLVTVEGITSVLLTGVTGTLGPFILAELATTSQITEIICLVTKRGGVSCEDRMIKTLVQWDLLDKIDMTKVSCVEGDVAKERLGMEDGVWNNLCGRIDAVFHPAAKIQHGEYYREKEIVSQSDSRAVNIQGTKNVLKFASSGEKLKHVFYASSNIAVTGIDKEGNYLEDWPETHQDYTLGTNLVYTITKYVGEVLMKEAVVNRGIPGKVFRFPLITGHSITGRCVVDTNHLMLRYLYFLRNGMMPAEPVPVAALPVDVCAKLSVQVFFNTDAPNEIYNVINYQPELDQKFTEIAQLLGHPLKIVDATQFEKETQNSAVLKDVAFQLFNQIARHSDEAIIDFSNSRLSEKWLTAIQRNEYFVKSKKLEKYAPELYEMYGREPSMSWVCKDFLFAKSQGWLDKYLQ